MLLSLPENLPITEANVLVAYAYLWQQRRLYNQTGGQQGAYLVASNGSFGIDRGRAADYPLWCAMIDSLGQEGILTVASTANMPLNVEQMGDMPTTCPSPYLIAVTQTEVVSDALYPSSAYGAQSIDLAAPGAVYTTRLDSSYNVFGGTSGAAPHVAGAVGLLYALPNASWGQLQSQDPSAAALLVKAFLLQSVDPQPSLRGKTVSGGRLQLGRAMEQLEAYFLPPAQGQLQLLSDPLSSHPLVQVDLPQAGQYEWQLYDALGRRCWQQTWTEAAPGRRWLRLPLPELGAGTYVLHLHGQGQRWSTKWTKGR
jgi:subtilisin family serine protease